MGLLSDVVSRLGSRLASYLFLALMIIVGVAGLFFLEGRLQLAAALAASLSAFIFLCLWVERHNLHLTQIRQDLFQARHEFLQAKHELLQAKSELASALGERLEYQVISMNAIARSAADRQEQLQQDASRLADRLSVLELGVSGLAEQVHAGLAVKMDGIASSFAKGLSELGEALSRESREESTGLMGAISNAQDQLNAIDAASAHGFSIIQEQINLDICRIEGSLSTMLKSASNDLMGQSGKLEFLGDRLSVLVDNGESGFASLQQRMEADLRLFERGMQDLEGAIKELFAGMHGSFSELAKDHAVVVSEAEHRVIEIVENTKEQLLSTADDEHWLKDVVRRGFAPVKIGIVQEVEALLQLRQVLDVRQPIALLGGWAMEPVSLLGIVKLILERKPELVVELGGGASTIWLAYALRQAGGGRIVSIDHLAEYQGKTRAALLQHGLEDYAETRLAPLEAVAVGEETFNWYQASTMSGLDGIDILLVDGPPAKSGPAARYPAVPLLKNSLHAGALVILDDADRKAETKITKRWLRENSQLALHGSIGERTTVYQWN